MDTPKQLAPVGLSDSNISVPREHFPNKKFSKNKRTFFSNKFHRNEYFLQRNASKFRQNFFPFFKEQLFISMAISKIHSCRWTFPTSSQKLNTKLEDLSRPTSRRKLSFSSKSDRKFFPSHFLQPRSTCRGCNIKHQLRACRTSSKILQVERTK